MNNTINWENIVDNYKGFEKLAVEFINSKYENIKWERTPQTRDGNVDAIAIVMGYQSNKNKPIHWWMEAKYSNSSEKLTRYRIDSTVVSALIEGNVHKIVFVTNIIIDSKTMVDITEALKYTANCADVEFYTKYSLEYWIYTNPNIYLNYFKTIDKALPQLLDDFIVSQEITYYDATAEHMSFKEPQRELLIEKEYIAYFSIFATKNTEVSVCSSNSLKGIRFLSKVKNVPIHKGENFLSFRFKLKENYGYKKSKRKDVPMPSFFIEKKIISSCRHISVINKKTLILDIKSQNKALKLLKDYFSHYYSQPYPCIILFTGKTDVGKSMLLDDFIKQQSLLCHSIFYNEFTESITENAKIILNLLIYIFFPYVSPDTIDKEYVKNIENIEIKEIILSFLEYKNNHDRILTHISNLLSRNNIFPNKILINNRVIIVDNIHLLDRKSAFLVSKIIHEIYSKKFPIFIIICGNQHYLDSSSYRYLSENCIIKSVELKIRFEDIIQCCNIPENKKYDLSFFNDFGFDATVTVLFYKYMMTENLKITTLQELIIAIRVFWISDIVEKHILSRFKTILSLSDKYRIILDKVYWSCSPIDIADLSDYTLELQELFIDDLIKYNSDGKIISKHSLYKTYYKKHFLPISENMEYTPGSPEDIRIKLLTSIDINTLQNCINIVSKLFYSKHYYSVDYILEDVFDSDKHLALKQIICLNDYYLLYYFYAYAMHQNGETEKCQSIFSYIQQETITSYNAKLLHIALKCIWELGVIAYENMQYLEITEWKNKAEEIIEKIWLVQKTHNISKNYVHFHDFRVLDALIKRETYFSKDNSLYYEYLSDMKAYGFQYRALSFSARYALTLCTINITLAIKILQETSKEILSLYGNEDKHYLWCMFYYNFYMMVWKNDYSYFQETVRYHEKMRKNQYGNYRKKLYAMAAYLYSINDKFNGDRYLFQDTIFPFESRKRYKAFYYETLALYEAINKNLKTAIEYLDKAISIFKGVDSYISIPLHNRQLLAENIFSASKISFLFNSDMDKYTYYIDPRSAW